MNTGTPTPPELCPNCKPLVESSKLEWVKVGGMSVGLHRQPLQWVLRDKYSSDMLNMNAKYSQQLAAKSRELAAVTEQRDRLEKLEEEVINFLTVNERFGYGASMSHPRVTMALSRLRRFTKE